MTNRLAALVLILSAGAANGAELGRLFFTPAQRATLDNARKQNLRTEIGNDEERPPAPGPQNVTVSGVVRRSDGKSTVWINNRPVTEKHAGGLDVSTNKNDNRVRLSVPESGRSVDLKVGQSVEILSGSIEEGYTRRTPPRPAAIPAPKPAAGANLGAPEADKTGTPPPGKP